MVRIFLETIHKLSYIIREKYIEINALKPTYTQAIYKTQTAECW